MLSTPAPPTAPATQHPQQTLQEVLDVGAVFEPSEHLRTVVVAVDSSEQAARALEWAMGNVSQKDDEIVLVNVRRSEFFTDHYAISGPRDDLYLRTEDQHIAHCHELLKKLAGKVMDAGMILRRGNALAQGGEGGKAVLIWRSSCGSGVAIAAVASTATARERMICMIEMEVLRGRGVDDGWKDSSASRS
ncbi:hypothetical protein BDK51DRAFT_40056 [Blyttiomyces helicus]|uniref:UspA domain-containing protein n=1 Tax=Blyttiomyces helicus TaxID=388810 RepID=A0A4P9W3W3_9FUNG|nr:hypothetical protein BDK51DRAFT_40056 [Blyttiomyces helicus]|eukprot:RKO87021.1 hypothetical protein BDK51DRAFT_40056 [Blyttiomyces helicus]